MTRKLRPVTGIVALVAVIFATAAPPGIAQERSSGRRTSAAPPVPDRTSDWIDSALTAEPVAAEAEVSGEPTETIAMTLWILRVDEPAQAPDDELSVNLADRINNLPHVFGDADQVRDLIAKLKVAGMLRDSREFRTVTLEGRPVMAQRGGNMPRVVATSVDPHAGRVNSLQLEPIGTIIEMMPRIDSNRSIQVSIKLNASQMEKSDEVVMAVTADGSPTFADVVTTRQFNAAASLKSGSALLLQSETLGGSRGEVELMFLSATILPTE